MVEAEDVTGVTFTPEYVYNCWSGSKGDAPDEMLTHFRLWMQRRHWALEVLRAEGVRSVSDENSTSRV